MDIKRGLLGVMVLAMMLAACSAPTAKPDAMMKESPTPDAMMAKETPTADAMMEKETPTADAMMSKGTPTADAMMPKSTPTADAMMEKETPTADAMMAPEPPAADAMTPKSTPTADAMIPKSTPTADAMMKGTPTANAMMAPETPAADAMMPKSTPIADAMLMHATPTTEAMMGQDAMSAPIWFSAKLTDVNTGKSFQVADFPGKVVLVETMAVWCTTCLQQQGQVQTLRGLLGKRDDFVTVALDIDPNENDSTLKTHANSHGFDWMYAVAPADWPVKSASSMATSSSIRFRRRCSSLIARARSARFSSVSRAPRI